MTDQRTTPDQGDENDPAAPASSVDEPISTTTSDPAPVPPSTEGDLTPQDPRRD